MIVVTHEMDLPATSPTASRLWTRAGSSRKARRRIVRTIRSTNAAELSCVASRSAMEPTERGMPSDLDAGGDRHSRRTATGLTVAKAQTTRTRSRRRACWSPAQRGVSAIRIVADGKLTATTSRWRRSPAAWASRSKGEDRLQGHRRRAHRQARGCLDHRADLHAGTGSPDCIFGAYFDAGIGALIPKTAPCEGGDLTGKKVGAARQLRRALCQNTLGSEDQIMTTIDRARNQRPAQRPRRRRQILACAATRCATTRAFGRPEVWIPRRRDQYRARGQGSSRSMHLLDLKQEGFLAKLKPSGSAGGD